MTEYETVRLLDRIEAYDPSFFSHTKMDKLAVAVWNVVLDGINYEDAVEAVVCHYRASADRITPYKTPPDSAHSAHSARIGVSS